MQKLLQVGTKETCSQDNLYMFLSSLMAWHLAHPWHLVNFKLLGKIRDKSLYLCSWHICCSESCIICLCENNSRNFNSLKTSLTYSLTSIQERGQSKECSRTGCCTLEWAPSSGFFRFKILFFCYLKTASGDRRLEPGAGMEGWCLHQRKTPGWV